MFSFQTNFKVLNLVTAKLSTAANGPVKLYLKLMDSQEEIQNVPIRSRQFRNIFVTRNRNRSIAVENNNKLQVLRV